MIESIFTIDYEIYGNGNGSLRELVYEPAEKLWEIFRKWNAQFVTFVEVAELEMIEAKGTDPDIGLVKDQIQKFYKEGFELGLHLHPQWYNASFENGKWHLDYSEYNLCTLTEERIAQIVERSIVYLRNILGESDFTPLSFRAGNWLFQPTQSIAAVLSDQGVKVDSSVFKGGMQYQHKLDYRRALKNGYYWTFSDNVNVPDPNGDFLELPIYTNMVPFWKMLTTKRIEIQRNGSSSFKNGNKKLHRLPDYLRLWHPMKFDFCRMTLSELTDMVDKVIFVDKKDPTSFRPIVAIGHTKDLVDCETVESFLDYLMKKGIVISTLEKGYEKCKRLSLQAAWS